MSSIIELAISEPKHLPWISDWVAELSRLRRQTRISGAAAESSDPSSSKRFQISPAEAMASLKLASFRDIVTSIQERYAGWEGVKAIGLWDDTCKVYFKSQEAYSQFNPFNKTYQYELDNNLISFTLTRWYEDAAYFKIINCDVMKKGWIADFGKSKSEWARENNITIQRVFIVRSEMYWVVPLQAAPRLLKDVNVALGGHLGTAIPVDSKSIVLLCWKCLEYGHFGDSCPPANDPVCKKCLGQHVPSECPQKQNATRPRTNPPTKSTLKCYYCEGNHVTGSTKCVAPKVIEAVEQAAEKGKRMPAWLRMIPSHIAETLALIERQDCEDVDTGCFDNQISHSLSENPEPEDASINLPNEQVTLIHGSGNARSPTISTDPDGPMEHDQTTPESCPALHDDCDPAISFSGSDESTCPSSAPGTSELVGSRRSTGSEVSNSGSQSTDVRDKHPREPTREDVQPPVSKRQRLMEATSRIPEAEKTDRAIAEADLAKAEKVAKKKHRQHSKFHRQQHVASGGRQRFIENTKHIPDAESRIAKQVEFGMFLPEFAEHIRAQVRQLVLEGTCVSTAHNSDADSASLSLDFLNLRPDTLVTTEQGTAEQDILESCSTTAATFTPTQPRPTSASMPNNVSVFNISGEAEPRLHTIDGNQSYSELRKSMDMEPSTRTRVKKTKPLERRIPDATEAISCGLPLSNWNMKGGVGTVVLDNGEGKEKVHLFKKYAKKKDTSKGREEPITDTST